MQLDPNLHGMRSYNINYKAICPMCKESYIRYMGETEWKLREKNKELKFCSFNCMRKYRRINQIEDKLVDSHNERNITVKVKEKPLLALHRYTSY